MSEQRPPRRGAADESSVNAIEVRHVSKWYRRYSRSRQFSTLKSALISGSPLRASREEGFQALTDVSFDVARGRTFGIIGRNGSGKSSLLKLIAGIGTPTSGQVSVSGRVSALIEVGAGFHPEISGRENVFINGMMLGLTKREVAKRFDDIVAFAELEPFIDAPVKTYSSGMYMRLGFSVAIHVDPEVLLVDEVLSVGDEGFTHKCLDRFADLKRRGRTILLVTHALDLVTRLCDEVLWLDAGISRDQGDPRRVIDAYLLDVAAKEREQWSSATSPAPAAAVGEQVDMFQAVEGRWGSRLATIENVTFIDAAGQPTTAIETGSRLEVRFNVRSQKLLDDLVIGVGVFGADGTCCFGTNTDLDGATGGRLDGLGEVRFVVPALDLADGTYKVDVAIHQRDGVPYDYHRQLYTLHVRSRGKGAGVYRPARTWHFHGSIQIQGL